MKLLSKNLKESLAIVSAAIPTNPVLPVLDGILLQASGSQLVMTATDLTVSVVTKVSYSGGDQFEVVVPRLFIDTIKSSAAETAEINFHNSDHLIVKLGGGTFKIPVMPAKDFPAPPSPDGEMEYIGVINLEKVSWAAASDELRPVLAGVYWHQENGILKLVATDQYKMAIAEHNIHSTASLSFVIPKRSVIKLGGELAVTADEKRVWIETPDRTIIAQKIEATYPDYQRVIPAHFPILLTAPIGEVTAAARAIGVYANKVSRSMKLEVVGSKLSLSAIDLDGGCEGVYDIECVSNKDFEIYLNSSFFAEAVGRLESFKMHAISHDKPVIFEDENSSLKVLVMPIQNNQP
jgi:DNA polymerase-3 subunit beta